MSLTRVGESDRFDGDGPVRKPRYDLFMGTEPKATTPHLRQRVCPLSL